MCVPAGGMRRIPGQLADALPAGVVRTGVRVTGLRDRTVDTDQGPVRAPTILMAADPLTATTLLDLPSPRMLAVTTVYHVAPEPPVAEPTLVLDGEGRSPIVNSVVLTNAAPSYAPDHRALISTSVLGPDAPDLRRDLERLYGVATTGWEHLATVPVRHALPAAPRRWATCAGRSSWAAGCSWPATTATPRPSRARWCPAGGRPMPCCGAVAG